MHCPTIKSYCFKKVIYQQSLSHSWIADFEKYSIPKCDLFANRKINKETTKNPPTLEINFTNEDMKEELTTRYLFMCLYFLIIIYRDDFGLFLCHVVYHVLWDFLLQTFSHSSLLL